MKKIMSTTLTAVVLSVAVVASVSARDVRPKNNDSKVAANKRAIAMKDDANQLNALVKDMKTMSSADKAEATKSATELAKGLLEDLANDRTVEKLAELEIQKDQLLRDIDAKKADIAAMATESYFYFWNRVKADQQEAYKAANLELKEMQSTLKTVEAAIKGQVSILGRIKAASVKATIGALTTAALAGLAYGIDKYTGNRIGFASAVDAEYAEAKALGARAYAADRYGKGKARASSAYESGKSRASSMYNSAKTRASNAKNRLFGTTTEEVIVAE